MEDQVTIEVAKSTHYEQIMELVVYCFRGSPGTTMDKPDDRRKELEADKAFVALDNTKVVATARIVYASQNVRGSVIPCGGVSLVASFPEARRKGAVKQLLIKLLQDLNDQQIAVSTLYPFKESFYEKFGYTVLPLAKQVVFNPKGLLPLLNKQFNGTIERVKVDDTIVTEFYALVEQSLQPRVHGMMAFTKKGRKDRYVWFQPLWAAKAVVNGKVEGIMLYNITGFRDKLDAGYFLYTSSVAKYLLLQFLAHHADQIKEVSLRVLPSETVEYWVSDLEFVIQRPQLVGGTSGMARVVNVLGLSGIPTCSANHKFVADIKDAQCPWNQGVFCFEAVNGKIQVTKLPEKPENSFELTIQGLSALVFNGISPSDLAMKGYGNPQEKMFSVLQEMFPQTLPFLMEAF